jgi:threonine/homoserine/homoserine lactone efflux protein
VALAFFLFQVFVISLSGVMQPGPVTATAIVMGADRRWAGVFITLGHCIIEFPVALLIVLGMGKLLESAGTQMVISLAGGVFLLIMAGRMLVNLNTLGSGQPKSITSKPILAGIILSAGNPYFLIWWATIGLALATSAKQLGLWAFVLFVTVHWLCDGIWLGALSWASFKGSGLLGDRGRRIVLLICSVALLVFGLLFIYNAVDILIKK